MQIKQRVVSLVILSVVTVSLLVPSLHGQQETPALGKVLDEGIVAAKLLAKREATEDGVVANGFMVRGLLAFALLRSDRRGEIDELCPDAKERQQLIELSEDQLVEVTGVVPDIPGGMEPIAEMLRRQLISMSLARRGDYEAAAKQITAFPKQPQRFAFVIRAYKFIADRQLEKKDLAGVRRTVRELWPHIRDLEIEDELRKTEWIIDLADLTIKAGEQQPAKSLCEIADKQLRDAIQKAKDEPQRINSDLRALAIAYAACGQADRATELLDEFERRGDTIEDDQVATFEYDLETARASVATSAGKKAAALEAYARAAKWAEEINRDRAIAFADSIDKTGFLAGLLALGEGSNFRTIALGQLELGDKQAALKTLERMPRCLQKPATLLEMAKIFHAAGAMDEARGMAARCAKLVDLEAPGTDHAMLSIFVVNIHHALGDNQAAQEVIKQLIANPRIQTSPEAKQAVAGELVTLKMFADAYSVIQSIEQPADRAIALAKLAFDLAKQP